MDTVTLTQHATTEAEAPTSTAPTEAPPRDPVLFEALTAALPRRGKGHAVMTLPWTEKAKGIARKAFAAAWRSGSPALRHRAAVALGRLYLREAERAYGRPTWRGPAGACTTRPDVAPLPVLVARGGAR